jgi:hypothetical protein
MYVCVCLVFTASPISASTIVDEDDFVIVDQPPAKKRADTAPASTSAAAVASPSVKTKATVQTMPSGAAVAQSVEVFGSDEEEDEDQQQQQQQQQVQVDVRAQLKRVTQHQERVAKNDVRVGGGGWDWSVCV